MVSVIITTCKRSPKMVKRAIESVINQTYSEWELLVIDDSPADYELRSDVADVVKSILDDRIKYIPLEMNLGGGAARNRGIQNSNGEYITFLDDDDMYLPEKLELQVKALIDNPDCGWTSGTLYKCRVNNEGNVVRKKLANNYIPSGYIFDALIFGKYVPSICAMVKREVLKEVGGFDETMPAAQDLDLWLRIGKISRFCIIDKPLFMQCIHQGERVTRSPEKKLLAYQNIINKYSDYMSEHPEAKARFLQNQVKYLIWEKKQSEAHSLMKLACGLNKKKSLEYRLRYIYWEMTYGRK